MRASGKWMARIGSILATVGFFLPSVLVSCSSFGFGQNQTFSIYEMASNQLINQGVLYMVPILLIAALALACIPTKVYGGWLAVSQFACLLGVVGAFVVAGLSMSSQAQKISGPSNLIPFFDLSKAVSIEVTPQYGAVFFGGGFLLTFLGIVMQLLGKESPAPGYASLPGQPPPWAGYPPQGAIPPGYPPQGMPPASSYPAPGAPPAGPVLTPMQPGQPAPGAIPSLQSSPLTPMAGFGEEAATQAVSRIPQLEVTGGPATGRIFPLTSAQMVIGRAPTCDICLADTTVSRKHAILWNDQGSWCIADQGSTSGTIVNGQRVQSARLNSGDTITLGAITLTLTG